MAKKPTRKQAAAAVAKQLVASHRARSRKQEESAARLDMLLVELMGDPQRNAGRAYLRAGLAPAGMTPVQASKAAHKLLSRKGARERWAELLAEQVERLKIEPDALVQRWWSAAFVNLDDVMSWDERGMVTLKPARLLDAGMRAAVSRFHVDRFGCVTVELGGREAAERNLGLHLGLTSKREVAVGDSDGNPLVPVDELRRLVNVFETAVATGLYDPGIGRQVIEAASTPVEE